MLYEGSDSVAEIWDSVTAREELLGIAGARSGYGKYATVVLAKASDTLAIISIGLDPPYINAI